MSSGGARLVHRDARACVRSDRDAPSTGDNGGDRSRAYVAGTSVANVWGAEARVASMAAAEGEPPSGRLSPLFWCQRARKRTIHSCRNGYSSPNQFISYKAERKKPANKTEPANKRTTNMISCLECEYCGYANERELLAMLHHHAWTL